MSIELEEIGPGMFRVKRNRGPVARSDLPAAFVISDEMPATEQVDGKFYTSKKQFRAVGRALGLTEVGNEKFKPFVRSTDKPETKRARQQALKDAHDKYEAGHRAGGKRIV